MQLGRLILFHGTSEGVKDTSRDCKIVSLLACFLLINYFSIARAAVANDGLECFDIHHKAAQSPSLRQKLVFAVRFSIRCMREV